MEKNQVKELVQRAIDDLSPKGVEFAWEGPNGINLKWIDILGSFDSEGSTITIVSPDVPIVGPILDLGPDFVTGARHNGIL